MGQFFELYEAGILDANGEYTGYMGAEHYRQRRPRPKKTDPNYDPVRGVEAFIFQNIRGNKVSQTKKLRIIMQYGKEQLNIDTLPVTIPAGKKLLKQKFEICRQIQANWKAFASWFDTTYGSARKK